MARTFNKFSAYKEELVRVAITNIVTDQIGSAGYYLKINLTKPNNGIGDTEHLPITFTPDESKEIFDKLKAHYGEST